jgi:hypothetical protein
LIEQLISAEEILNSNAQVDPEQTSVPVEESKQDNTAEICNSNAEV